MKTIERSNHKRGARLLFFLTLLTASYARAEEPSIQSAAEFLYYPWASAGKESASDFRCPNHQVMVGRRHNGDEHGQTSYACGLPYQFGSLRTRNSKTYAPQAEPGFHFTCDKNTIMTGRKHQGDEKGPTTYTCAEVVDSWGHTMEVTPVQLHTPYKESSHEFECPKNQAIAGRNHDGDENGQTQYLCAQLW